MKDYLNWLVWYLKHAGIVFAIKSIFNGKLKGVVDFERECLGKQVVRSK
jgi:hypothetical protein